MYEAKCPFCGKVNRNMYLEETDGWMECDHCGKTSNCSDIVKLVLIPMIHATNPLSNRNKAMDFSLPEGRDAV